MSGKYKANYRRATRTLNEFNSADEVLQRMLINKPDFFIGNPAIITRPDADAAIDIYLQRMKLEQTFRDLKSYLGIDKNMSHSSKEKTCIN